MDEQMTLNSTTTGPRLPTVNPATGEAGQVYDGHTLDQALSIVADVARAQKDWRRTPVADRAVPMRRAAQILRTRAEDFIALMTAEMGKTLTQGRAEIEKCAVLCDYFADHAAEYLAPRPHSVHGEPDLKAYVTYNPLGVVLAVMPWNFPFWQAMRGVVPHLMAGNGVVLKHASNVPGCALAFETIFRDAGFPADVFRTLLIGSRDVKAVIEDSHIAGVTLTGSVGAGKSVAAVAGAVLKPCVLELGGSDAYLVLEDADIAHAARTCVMSRMTNTGQACDGAKRFIVVEAVRAEFEAAVVAEMQAYVMGDPKDAATKVGPMEGFKTRDEIADQVKRSLDAGARLLLGGVVPDRPGAWYPATILTDVRPGQAAYEEEIFGPVASIIPAVDEADAIRIANDSSFGLGGAVFTRDLARGERIAAEDLDSGSAFVNRNVRSNPAVPFGGIKDSGYGRELSDLGIHAFCNIKTVMVQPPQ